MHGLERVSGAERPLPRLVLPARYDHLGTTFESPILDTAIVRLHPKMRVSPPDLFQVISCEIQDIQDQRRQFWQDDEASKPWRDRQRLLHEVQATFAKNPDAKVSFIENADSPPFTVRRDELDMLFQSLDPFTAHTQRLQRISQTLVHVFGLSTETFNVNEHKDDIQDAYDYIRQQRDRYQYIKGKHAQTIAEDSEMAWSAIVFSRLGGLIEDHVDIFQEMESLAQGVDTFDTAKFTADFNHFAENGRYLSPLLDGEIANKSRELMTTGREATVFDVCDLIAAEIADLEDQEQTFKDDPDEVKILKSSDFTDTMELKFFKDQILVLEQNLSIFELLIAPPKDPPIPNNLQRIFHNARLQYLDRLETRWNRLTQQDELEIPEEHISLFQKIRNAVTSPSQNLT